MGGRPADHGPTAARRHRDWTRALQVVVGLAAIATVAAVLFWTAATVYYATQRGAGPSYEVIVGATLPDARQIEPTPTSTDLPTGTSLVTGEPLPVAIRAPSTTQYALAILERLPTLVVYATFFVLLWRLLRAARREELFSMTIAARLRGLGGLLLGGALAAAALESVAQGLLAMDLLANNAFVFDYDVPGGAVIGGVGLLAVAEVVRRGTGMREDLEGTV